MSDKQKAFWFIATLSVLVIIPFLGETLFHTKGEPREAIVGMAILESGNWILPLNYGTDIAYKPPFLYWCIAAFSYLSGEVTEFSSRLPSALSFLAMQFFFFFFISKWKGVRTAVLTSILLLTSFEVHRAAFNCRLDMLQVSFIVISLCLLFRWDEKGCRGVPWIAVLLMACASMTKGPVGSIFPCLVTGIYQLVRGRSFAKTFFSLAGIGLLSLLPLGLWFLAAYHQGGAAFSELMLEENTGRFFGKMSYESHENPLWYNFLTLIWGWVPWTLLLFASLFVIRWKGLQVLPAGTTLRLRLLEAWKAFRRQSPVQLFIWLAILVIFIFYCIPKSKRSVYLLPVYPFMAVLIAEYLLALVQQGKRKLFKVCSLIFACLGVLLTVVFGVVRMGLLPDSIWGTGRHAAENVAFMHALEEVSLSFPQWLLVLLPLVAAVCVFRIVYSGSGAAAMLYGIAGCVLCIFVSLDGVYQPTVLNVKSDKQLAEQVKTYVPEGKVYSFSQMSFYNANFYLGDRMRHIEKERPADGGYLLVSEREEEQMFKELGVTYRFEKIFRTDKRSCDMRSPVSLYRFEPITDK